MTWIWIDGPNKLFNKTLASLVRRNGHRPSFKRPDEPSLVIRDLQHLRPPYPLPEHARTLAFVTCMHEELVQLLRLGYQGYLPPSCNESTLSRAIAAVLKGENWGERAVIAQALAREHRRTLTPREQAVYDLIRRGYSNRQIANVLGIRPNTVKVYSSSVLHKLDVRSRTELILPSINAS